MMWDTVAAQDEEARRLRSQYCFQPMMRPDEMRQSFVAQGLVDVAQTSLLIRMDYENFADYWEPIAAGEGPLGKYVAALDPARRAQSGRGGERRLRGRPTGRPTLLRGGGLGVPGCGAGSSVRRCRLA